MVDSLDRLRHHGVVSSDHNDTQVGNLGTAGTHSSKCFVTRRIQEGDLTTVGQTHFVSTDVLRDTTGLTGNDVGLADVVQQRGFTVVNVTHHGDDRVTWQQIFLSVSLFRIVHIVFLLCIDEFHFETELFGQHGDVFSIQTLVDGDEKTDTHASRDDLGDIDIHQSSQLVGGDELGHAQRLLIFNCLKFLFFNTFVDKLTFLFSSLGCRGSLLRIAFETHFGLLDTTVDIFS